MLGSATGALVATVNGCVKPLAGSLASATWLGRGMYASMKKHRRKKRNTEERSIINKVSVHASSSLSSSSSSDDNEEEQHNDEDIPTNIKFAAVVSGYPADICQQILDEFEKVKKHQEQLAALSPNQNDTQRRKYLFRRHRSHSDSAL
jgi:hypothetical protein